MTDVPIVPLDEDGATFLTELTTTPESGWYIRRRTRALALRGMLAAADWNPYEHPRGPDGKFIRKFGLVRWLKNGLWERGMVLAIHMDTGKVDVAPSTPSKEYMEHALLTFTHDEAEKKLYSLPRSKAKLHLPDPKAGTGASGWKQTGGQGGSNPGAMYTVTEDAHVAIQVPADVTGYESPQAGEKYYIKTAKSQDHARQEALANDLYELGGVAVPLVTTSFDDTQIASRVVKETSTKEMSLDPHGDPAVLSKVRENLVFDAWLGNWDVVGAVYDNMQVVDGIPVRVDTGGALMYRAKGGAKGDIFGPKVIELDSLRNADVNPEGASIFGATTQGELEAGGERLRAITPQAIRDAVEARDLPDTLADLLIARRTSVLTQIGMDDIAPKPKADPFLDAAEAAERLREDAYSINIAAARDADLAAVLNALPAYDTAAKDAATRLRLNDYSINIAQAKDEDLATVLQAIDDANLAKLIADEEAIEQALAGDPWKAPPEFVIDEPKPTQTDVYKALDNVNQEVSPYGNGESITEPFEDMGDAGLGEASTQDIHWNAQWKKWDLGPGNTFSSSWVWYENAIDDLTDQGDITLDSLAGNQKWPDVSPEYIVRTEGGMYGVQLMKDKQGASYTAYWRNLAFSGSQPHLTRAEYGLSPAKTLHVYSVNPTLAQDSALLHTPVEPNVEKKTEWLAQYRDAYSDALGASAHDHVKAGHELPTLLQSSGDPLMDDEFPSSAFIPRVHKWDGSRQDLFARNGADRPFGWVIDDDDKPWLITAATAHEFGLDLTVVDMDGATTQFLHQTADDTVISAVPTSPVLEEILDARRQLHDIHDLTDAITDTPSPPLDAHGGTDLPEIEAMEAEAVGEDLSKWLHNLEEADSGPPAHEDWEEQGNILVTAGYGKDDIGKYLGEYEATDISAENWMFKEKKGSKWKGHPLPSTSDTVYQGGLVPYKVEYIKYDDDGQPTFTVVSEDGSETIESPDLKTFLSFFDPVEDNLSDAQDWESWSAGLPEEGDEVVYNGQTYFVTEVLGGTVTITSPSVGLVKSNSMSFDNPADYYGVVSLPSEPEELPEPADIEAAPGGKFSIVGVPRRVSSEIKAEVLQDLVGKNVYLKPIKGSTYYSTQPAGFFTVMKVNETTYNGMVKGLELKSAQGLIYTWSTGGDKEASIVETEYAPPHIKNITLKQDGSINVNGYTVGTWSKDNKYNVFTGFINQTHSPTGEMKTINSLQKKELKRMVAPQVLVPGAFDTHDAKPKSAPALAIKKQTLDVTFSAEGPTLTDNAMDVKTLGDGSDAKVGMWVVSSWDGSVGQIDEIVGIHHFKQGGYEKAYGYVKVKYPNGKTGVRSSKTLYASPDPNTGAVPPVAPKWEHVKLGDDTQPYPSQMVLTDVGESVQILDLKMAKGVGLVKVRQDNKNVWIKASTVKADPKNPMGVETADLSPAGILAVLEAEGVKNPNKLAKAGDVAYPGPGNKTITQPQTLYEKWFDGNPDRKLTKDGFVPTIGLWVRDKDGVSYRVTKVANSWATNPNSVTVWDSESQSQKTKVVSTLWVDHEQELDALLTVPLTNIKIELTSNTYWSTDPMPPNATALYIKPSKYTHSANTPTYLVTTSDGTVHWLGNHGSWHQQSDYFKEHYQPWGAAPIKKIANINPEDPNEAELVLTGNGFNSNPYVAVIGKKGEHDLAVAEKANTEANAPKPEPVPEPTIIPEPEPTPAPIETPDVSNAPEPAPGTVGIPPKYDGGLSPLPKPADAPDPPQPEPGKPLGKYPTPPDMVGDPTRLGGEPAVPQSLTVEQAYNGVVDRWKKGEFSPGSGVQYSMTDSDKIEDMTVRTQIAENVDGKNYVEVRFNLLEPAVDDLSDRLLAVENEAPILPVGGWEETPVFVSDLVPGDRMAARVSTFEDLAGTLKPEKAGTATTPNVMVTDFPLLIGKSPDGVYDVYSVPIVNAAGEPGVIYVQKRESPSIGKFDWDPDKMPPPVSTGSVKPATVSPVAEALGWKIHSTKIGTSKVHDAGWHGLEVDQATGVKQIDLNNPNVHKIDADDSRSKKLRLSTNGGSMVDVQVTHTSSPRTIGGSYSSHSNYGRRTTPNGEVIIRVPVEHPDPMGEISRLMAAVGVDPESQDQPTNEEIVSLGLNKVYKQLAPDYKHMKQPKQGDVQGVVKLIDDVLGDTLGRPATIDDIRLRINPQGAPTIVFSDEVANAFVAKNGTKVLYSVFESGGMIPEKLKVIAASRLSQGLLGADERWSAGIFLNGTYGPSSPTDDAKNDAGNRIFFHQSKSGTIGLQAGIIYSPAAVLFKQTDWYWTSGDVYGTRSDQNRAFLNYTGNSGQVMVKRMFEGDLWGRVVVQAGTEKPIVDTLKQQGVTELGGRPIEDVIVEPQSGATVADIEVPLTPPGSVEIPISQAGVGGTPAPAPTAPALPGIVV